MKEEGKEEGKEEEEGGGRGREERKKLHIYHNYFRRKPTLL